jgi:hypothetical protein
VRPPTLVATAVAGLAAAGLAPAVAADSFTPVRLAVRVAPVARRSAPLRIVVAVSADPGVLDGSDGPMRIEVKLAGECGGNFQTTGGVTLLNAALRPQPSTGRAYAATARGSGRPRAYGLQTVCVYLEDTGVGRVYANDEFVQVEVSPTCTVTALRYQAARQTLTRAERRLRRARHAGARRRWRRAVVRDRRAARNDRRRAVRACGAGVAL